MAEKKTVKKSAPVKQAKKTAPAAATRAVAKPAAKKPASAPPKKAAPAKAPPPPAVPRRSLQVLDAPVSVRPRMASGPTARTCPLVLDGEVDASDFSDGDCLTCGEFDCIFCESQNGSGALRSRLFAGSEDGDGEGGEDGWDLDFGGGEEGFEGDAEDGEDDELP